MVELNKLLAERAHDMKKFCEACEPRDQVPDLPLHIKQLAACHAESRFYVHLHSASMRRECVDASSPSRADAGRVAGAAGTSTWADVKSANTHISLSQQLCRP